MNQDFQAFLHIAPGWQFASDNTAGICPEAWAAMAAANDGFAAGYGEDDWTARACAAIRTLFEHSSAQVFFVFNGTAANALSLAAGAHSYHGIVCHEVSHVETDECSATEFFTHGARLLTVAGMHGKLTAPAVAERIARRSDLHANKPRMLTLSQMTEWGTLYDADEVRALASVAHQHGMSVHMDGARFANALAAQPDGVTAADLSWRAGVDILSLGGTKNGLASTDAVVIFDAALARDFDYRCKQAGQLSSKMRLQSSQWLGVLDGGAWQRHARHANAMARELARALAAIPGVRLQRPVEANAVFVHLQPALADALSAAGWHFYELGGSGYRFMCSWATSAPAIARLAWDLNRLAVHGP